MKKFIIEGAKKVGGGKGLWKKGLILLATAAGLIIVYKVVTKKDEDGLEIREVEADEDTDDSNDECDTTEE